MLERKIGEFMRQESGGSAGGVELEATRLTARVCGSLTGPRDIVSLIFLQERLDLKAILQCLFSCGVVFVYKPEAEERV